MIAARALVCASSPPSPLLRLDPAADFDGVVTIYRLEGESSLRSGWNLHLDPSYEVGGTSNWNLQLGNLHLGPRQRSVPEGVLR